MPRFLLYVLSLLSGLTAPALGETSGALREVWTNVDGSAVSDLTASVNFPSHPVCRVIDPSFKSPVDFSSRFGARMRAFLTPAAPANYTFWVSGNDSCELWLSPDADPANRVRIARSTVGTGAQSWAENADQRSAPVSLEVGRRYYIEALMKEGSGRDNLAVAWAASPADVPTVIGGEYLTAFDTPAAAAGTVLVEAGKPITQYAPNYTFTASGQALDLGQTNTVPPIIQWTQTSGAAATIANPTSLNTSIMVPAAGTYVFKVTATSAASVSGWDELTVTIQPPLAADAGKAVSEYWFGVSGGTVASLVNSLDYPNFPHAHRLVTSLTSNTSLADQYGERTLGFILVPVTGAYRFFVAADESMEFYLSTDASPSNLQLRASVAKAVGIEAFPNASQDSGLIQLTGGQRYAFEIRHKDDWGADHCTVLWQQPGEGQMTDITAEFLAPPTDGAAAVAASQDFNLDADYALNAGRDQVLYLPRTVASFSAYETRRIWGADTPAREWKVVSGPAGVVFSSAVTAATNATFPKPGTYTLRYSVTTARNTSSDDLTVEVRSPFNINTGSLTRQVWWNRNYASIDAMRADAAFPNYPDITDTIAELRQSNDWASLYGTRVSGILNVPPGGTAPVNYVFYVSGDDAVEFSISTDATPGNLRKVCYALQPTGRETWTVQATQTSAPVALQPGGRYFVELLHKETYGSDYFAVAWSREGDRRPQVIDGSYFEPAQKAAPFDPGMNYYANAGRDRTYYWPEDRAKLAGAIINVRGATAVPVTAWKQISGPKATLAEPANLASDVVFSGTGAYTFELSVTEGSFTHRDAVTITIAPQISGVKGSLTRSVWLDVDGNTVASLLTFDPTLAYPHFEDLLPGVEPPVNWADYYGTRLKGFVTVPIAGKYTFWLAADEAADLKFDLLDGNGLQRLAYLASASGQRNWTQYASQKSVTLDLQAKVAYPIELLHKEYGGNDHLSVAMDGPATNGREVLSRGFLSPFRSAPAFNPEITVALGSDRALLWPNNQLTLAALVYDLKQGPNPLTYKWSSTSSKVSFDTAASPVSVVKFSAPGIYELKMTASDGVNSGSDSVLVTVSNPLTAKSGGILRETWTSISGYTINDLKNAAAYAKAPNFTDLLSSFEAPSNWGDNYGQRLTGFIEVPTEGDYVFLVASDDASELWMNTTGEAATGAQKIAFTTSATGRYSWTRYASQKSAAIHLMPGKRYYIQALHKEGTGDDYFAVAYHRADQDDAASVVVPGVLLSPPDNAKANAFDGQISVRAGDAQNGYWPHSRYTLNGSAVDYVPGPQALAYRWTVLTAPAGAAAKVVFDAPTALKTDVTFPGPGSYKLQLTATDGVVSRSDALSITISTALGSGTGSILCETYRNITGSWVTDLMKSPKFPDQPDSRVQLATTEIPSNQGDNYGMLIRGYLFPPVSGVYRFNLASDDWSEVYISTDRTPEKKAMACFVPAGTDYYEWRKYPDYQLSRPIQLDKGKSYYIEIRFKESSYRDHLALAWLRPGSTAFEIIDGAFLAPWLLSDRAAPTITLAGGSDITLNVGDAYVDPGYSASDLVDGNITSSVTTQGTVDTSKAGTYIVRYTVTDAAGNQSVVATRRVTVAVADGQPAQYPADSGGSYSTAPWTSSASITDQEAARFLKQATFGPSDANIARVKAIGYSAWIDEQLALPPTSHLAHMDRIAQFQGAKSNLYALARTGGTMGLPGSAMATPVSLQTEDRLYSWWTLAATAPDQLRQRVAWALSEILVISDKNGTLRNYPRGCANYYDLLVKRIVSGGNYRDLLEDITQNPMMGIWLTHVRSSKTQPDENYPREIMQLFSIGLEHLNKDGTFKRDGEGNAIPSYGQNEILELSRAFTGWTYNNSRSFTSTGNALDEISPLMAFEDYHDRGRKVILGGATVPAGQSALQDIRRCLDVIAAHPNVGPFLARRLIQRLVTSNPSPAYIYRVSNKFNDNGKGVRGDICAVVKAILMDPEARTVSTASGAGKLNEPILRLTRLLRAFPRAPSDNPPILSRYLLQNYGDSLGQWPMQAPTVFNFFHPDYQPAGALLDAGLRAPEFEITTELTTTDIANYFFEGATNGFYTNSGARLSLDLTTLVNLWNTPEPLLAKIENQLLARPMSPGLREALLSIQALYATNAATGTKVMMQLLTATPEFSVDR